MLFFKTTALFLLLLPVFFVFHGFTAHYDYISIKDAGLLVVIYCISSFIIAGIAWLFYHDFLKASLIAFAAMAYNFFFGSLQDQLEKHFPDSFLSRYIIILPASAVLFILLLIGLKKTKRPLQRITIYLNLLFSLLIIIDIGVLTYKTLFSKDNIANGDIQVFTITNNHSKPDIYFIIADEYADSASLQEYFGFNNHPFENDLRSLGFRVISHSTSNYNSTPYSIASILNMNYLPLNGKSKGADLDYCYRAIRDNRLMKIVAANGYQCYNYSIFDLKGHPTQTEDYFLPTKSRLITSQTFSSRIWEYLYYKILIKYPQFHSLEKNKFYSHLHHIEDYMQLTSQTAALKEGSPKFVYTHLMMPHYPHYYDSAGHALSFDSLLTSTEQTRLLTYTGYLQYCNKKILSLVNDILIHSKNPPIIILAGDHGYRFTKKEERHYCFMNLAAIYSPGSTIMQNNDSLSAVNLFRVILNQQFKQQLPLLNDSSIYLGE